MSEAALFPRKLFSNFRFFKTFFDFMLDLDPNPAPEPEPETDPEP